MKKSIFVTLVIVIGIICCSVVALYFFLKPLDEVYKEKPINKTLVLSNGKEIYVRAIYRGITGDYEEIVFSESPITTADKEKDYVFYTDEVFYKITGDTLSLYACDCDTSEPKSSFKGVKVILNDLKTSSQIKDYSTNYQKYGLEKMSIYNE